jgi:fructosamine-3-kinase
MLPEHIIKKLQSFLDLEITGLNPQSGGDINEASILTFETGSKYFLKWNTSASDSMFETEAKGLELISNAKTELVIPDVILSGKSFLLMSVIDHGSGNSDSDFNFGIELAKLHKHSSESFGLDHDNFIGKLYQKNTVHHNWADFFISERIEPQIKLGIDSGKFSNSIFGKIQRLSSNIDTIFPKEPSALLHGDLWSGNYMFTKNGKASIYDPAVYYGHREMDLSMTRLFGGFSSEFYGGYQSEYPLADGFQQRIDLCNLYPILVHANLFGGGYVNQALRIIDKYGS